MGKFIITIFIGILLNYVVFGPLSILLWAFMGETMVRSTFGTVLTGFGCNLAAGCVMAMRHPDHPILPPVIVGVIVGSIYSYVGVNGDPSSAGEMYIGLIIGGLLAGIICRHKAPQN